MGKKLEKKVKGILQKSQKAFKIMLDYDEEPSEFSEYEIWIFSVYIQLLMEEDKELVDLAILHLINGIYKCNESNLELNDVVKHVEERLEYYPETVQSIEDNPDEYDLKPLYCAWYRYPFTDVHYASADPKYPDIFRRKIYEVISMLVDL